MLGYRIGLDSVTAEKVDEAHHLLQAFLLMTTKGWEVAAALAPETGGASWAAAGCLP